MSDAISRLNAALRGRYRIERQLGEGGMATVFLADDVKHKRKVALKVLKPELAAVVGADRFLAEIETTANLQHPHILPLYDSGEADSLLFYVMPYVEGESLRDRLDRERQLPVEDAVQIATNVAEALDYAHRQGVVHRDVKPANIMLQDGKPVISDFGIALAVGAVGGGRLTETGLSLGTPHYMSPEQATGDQVVGPAADIYALGCVLYEMLVGEPPFTGSTAQAVLGKIIVGEVAPVRDARRSVPANVDAVVRRALEKIPADRFSGAQGFSHALRVPGFRHGDAADARSKPSRSAWLYSAVGFAVALPMVWLLPRPSGQVATFGEVRKLTSTPGIEMAPAISPDGQEVAFVTTSTPIRPRSAAGANERPGYELAARIVVRGVEGGATSVLVDVPVGDEEYPSWSPGGDEILFQSAGRVFRVPSRGGTARAVVPAFPDASSGTATWSPDGQRVAFTRLSAGHDGIYVVDLASGEETLILETTEAHSLAWSPDGERIAYVENNYSWSHLGQAFGNVADSKIWVTDLDGNAAQVTGTGQSVSPAWLPDGRLLFVSSQAGAFDIYMVSLTADGSLRGEPTRLTVGLQPHTMTVSADGSRIAYTSYSRRQNIFRLAVPEDGVVSASLAVQVTTGQQIVEGIAVSPDGSWLAFDSDRAGNQDVYLRPLAGGEPVRITNSSESEFVRTWSSDGTEVAGHGFRDGVRQIFTVGRDGLGFQHVLTSPEHDRYPDLSPRGDRIVFSRARGVRLPQQVMLSERGPDGVWSTPRGVVEAIYVRWAPDGNRIAGVDSFRRRVFVHWLETGATEFVAEADPDPESLLDGVEWTESGDQLLVLKRNPDATSAIWVVPAEGGVMREAIRFDDPAKQPRSEMDYHDGEMYFTLSEFESDIWVVDVEWR